jgi:hypothetical protein
MSEEMEKHAVVDCPNCKCIDYLKKSKDLFKCTNCGLTFGIPDEPRGLVFNTGTGK